MYTAVPASQKILTCGPILLRSRKKIYDARSKAFYTIPHVLSVFVFQSLFVNFRVITRDTKHWSPQYSSGGPLHAVGLSEERNIERRIIRFALRRPFSVRFPIASAEGTNEETFTLGLKILTYDFGERNSFAIIILWLFSLEESNTVPLPFSLFVNEIRHAKLRH